jgi:hypothetical protein
VFLHWLVKGLGGEIARKVGGQTAHPPFPHQKPIFASLLDSSPAIAWR